MGGDCALAGVPQGQSDGTLERQQAPGRVWDVRGDVVLGAHDLVPERFDQRPGEAGGTGVTSPTHSDDSRGVSSGAGTRTRLRNAATREYRRIISAYVKTSGPPMSKRRLTPAGSAAQPTR